MAALLANCSNISVSIIDKLEWWEFKELIAKAFGHEISFAIPSELVGLLCTWFAIRLSSDLVTSINEMIKTGFGIILLKNFERKKE